MAGYPMQSWPPVGFAPRGQTIGGRNYYCWTKEARIRCAREYAGEIDPRARTTFADLPEPIAAEKLQQEEKVAHA
jgi:hypothetical protein